MSSELRTAQVNNDLDDAAPILSVRLEIPAFDLCSHISLRVRHTEKDRIFDGVQELLHNTATKFEDSLVSVTSTCSQSQIDFFRRRAVEDMDAWRAKVETFGDWRSRVEHATMLLDSMRSAYHKEVTHLRQQLHLKSKAEQQGMEFEPSKVSFFDPIQFEFENEVDRLVVERVAVVQRDFEAKLMEIEMQHAARTFGLNDQIRSLKVALRLRDEHIDKLSTFQNITSPVALPCRRGRRCAVDPTAFAAVAAEAPELRNSGAQTEPLEIISQDAKAAANSGSAVQFFIGDQSPRKLYSRIPSCSTDAGDDDDDDAVSDDTASEVVPSEEATSNDASSSNAQSADSSGDDTSSNDSSSDDENEAFCPSLVQTKLLPLKLPGRLQDSNKMKASSLKVQTPTYKSAIPPLRRPRAETAKPVRRVDILRAITAKTLARASDGKQTEEPEAAAMPAERAAGPALEAACSALVVSNCAATPPAGRLQIVGSGLAAASGSSPRRASASSWTPARPKRCLSVMPGGSRRPSMADRYETLLQGQTPSPAGVVGPKMCRHLFTGTGRVPVTAQVCSASVDNS